MGTQITVREMNSNNFQAMAQRITEIAGGNVYDCADWLSDGDVEDVDTLDELIAEWKEVDCQYTT